MKLLLFDIDGTLVNTHGAGLRAINRAFETRYGHPAVLDGISLAGRTDGRIMMDIFAKAGIDFYSDELDLIKMLYFENLAEELQNGQKCLLPGIAELVPSLHKNESIYLALLTGNWQHSARLKLETFGLNEYFPFGAFADDAVDRPDLVPVAVHRFERQYGFKPRPQDIYVIGDTPSDILCAKPHGVVSVAVATGSYSVKELQGYEPDFVLENLQQSGGTNLFSDDLAS
jgi:phosphoglycolate phosphatase-like HAD superfamily hydrolase